MRVASLSTETWADRKPWRKVCDINRGVNTFLLLMNASFNSLSQLSGCNANANTLGIPSGVSSERKYYVCLRVRAVRNSLEHIHFSSF